MGKVIPFRKKMRESRSFRETREEAETLLTTAHRMYYKGEYHKAVAFYEESAKLFDEITTPPVFLYSKLSDSYLMLEKFEQSASVLEEALEKHPDEVEILSKLGMLCIDRWEKIRNPLKAVSYFTRVKELEPNYREGCLPIDIMLFYAKQYAKQG